MHEWINEIGTCTSLLIQKEFDIYFLKTYPNVEDESTLVGSIVEMGVRFIIGSVNHFHL